MLQIPWQTLVCFFHEKRSIEGQIYIFGPGKAILYTCLSKQLLFVRSMPYSTYLFNFLPALLKKKLIIKKNYFWIWLTLPWNGGIAHILL